MSDWISYNDLAWVEPILMSPEDGEKEAGKFVEIIRKRAKNKVKTLLHFACGGGIYDYTFKKYFTVTGVDISPGMLEVARNLNPKVVYHEGDMRRFKLDEKFDAVAIPDSIGYMTTLDDLRSTIINACGHLKPGGILLITATIAEQFKENNFVYTGSRDNVEITVFENNYITDAERTTYEATIIYLIRRKGKLEIHTDVHKFGLFSRDTWLGLFKEQGLEVDEVQMDDVYAPYIMGEGDYPLANFVLRQKEDQP